MMGLLVLLMAVICCWTVTVDDRPMKNGTTSAEEDHDTDKMDKRGSKYYNYLPLGDNECNDCSVYKCTNHKDNLGGAEWCILPFSVAIDLCDSDPTCGGYTMTIAQSFHKKYDRNGEPAVHLTKTGGPRVRCAGADWVSYDKQRNTRESLVTYAPTICRKSGIEEHSCQKSDKYNYVFVSKSNTAPGINTEPYLCKNNEKAVDNKDQYCILPFVDGINHCNSDDKCEGFMVQTAEGWQKDHSRNGLQAVQLYGHGVKYTPSTTWQSYRKQPY